MRKEISAIIAALALVYAPSGRCATSDQSNKKYVPKDALLYAPKPVYPWEARSRRQIGSGIAVISVDPASGRVTNAVMARSTGYTSLDDAALNAFRQWRFKPGSTAKAKIPVNFTMSGEVITLEYKATESKPMSELLAPILGKGAVAYGPNPRYPSYKPWDYKEGRGVYELHVAKDGKVEDVKILKSSRDATFDSITVSTLRKWRLRKGPLIVELPLGFKMTPNTYDVYIP